MVTSVEIAGRKIGPSNSAFVIAEAGVNHNGSLDMAKRLVEVAAKPVPTQLNFRPLKPRRSYP